MNKTGFYLNRLRISGIGGKSSEIIFKKGLNVIVGPSNTGKTYIFDCINFMFGGNDIPDPIPEVNHYDLIRLEISTNDQKVYTLERSLIGGSFKKYNCSILEIDDSTSFTDLSIKHSKKKESVSKFLMDLAGFKDTNLYIIKNQKKEKQSFSYRNFNDLVLINELKIISKESPVHSDNNKTKTAEKSAFKLILSGKDDSNIGSSLVKSNHTGILNAQLELINKLIGEVKRDIDGFDNRLFEQDLSEQIKQLVFKKNGLSSEIKELSDHRKKLWTSIQQNKSKLLSTSELMQRFELLKEQYETDIQRLHFLLEGEHYFSLLNYERCPHCNQTLESNHECVEVSLEQKRESYTQEIHKIHNHLEDLSSTLIAMKNEHSVINTSIKDEEERYQLLSLEIDEQLTSQIAIVQDELRNVLERQKEINYHERLQSTLDKLINEQKEILQKIDNNHIQIETPQIEYDHLFEELCKDIQYYLEGWGYPGGSQVKYDRKHTDIFISDKPRKLFGKGFRSLSYSAFTLGLMKYCRSKNIPHPGLVVLDSPVTSYNDKDSQEDKPSEQIQQKFYEFLSDSNNYEQIIIFENKHPQPVVINKINYIEFTKSESYGRFGFITE